MDVADKGQVLYVLGMMLSGVGGFLAQILWPWWADKEMVPFWIQLEYVK